MTDSLELAWAAGLWDGEGCAYTAKIEGGRYKYLSLAVGQCYDPSVLHRFAAAVGHGNVTGPHPSGHGNAPSYKWRATGRPAERIADLLLPFLSPPKVEQIRRVREEVKQLEYSKHPKTRKIGQAGVLAEAGRTTLL